MGALEWGGVCSVERVSFCTRNCVVCTATSPVCLEHGMRIIMEAYKINDFVGKINSYISNSN